MKYLKPRITLWNPYTKCHYWCWVCSQEAEKNNAIKRKKINCLICIIDCNRQLWLLPFQEKWILCKYHCEKKKKSSANLWSHPCSLTSRYKNLALFAKYLLISYCRWFSFYVGAGLLQEMVPIKLYYDWRKSEVSIWQCKAKRI